MAEPKQTAAQRYVAVKPIRFNNPFSSWQEFQTQVGMPITAAWNGIQKVGNWIENSKFGKWANESTPRPIQKTQPSANERASMSNAGGKPLTAEEVAQMQAERRAGVQNIPAPTIPAPTLTPQPATTAPAKPAVPVNPGLFTGNLRSFQSRKNWVQEHKDYLKEKGVNIDWDNYRGTAEQNIALKRLLDGFDEWNAAKQKAAVPATSPSGLAIPVLNPNAPRKDIYNPATAVAPYAQVNPIVAAKKIGGKINYQKIFK